MESIKKGYAITLDNNKEYNVVDTIKYNDRKYIYLISEDEEVMLAEEIIEGDEVSIETLDNPDIIREILSHMFDKK